MNTFRRVHVLLKTERKLGLFDAVIMGLSGAIGFEVFVALGYPYFDLGLGAGIVVGLLVAGLINLLVMLTYCELSTAIPKVGGAYTYIKEAYGSFIPFISGSFRWLASIFGAAFAARAFYLQFFYLFQIVLAIDIFDLQLLSPLVTMITVAATTVFTCRGSKGVSVTIVFAFLAIFSVLIGSTLVFCPHLAPLEVLPMTLTDGVPKVLTTVVYTFTMFFGVRSLIAGASKIKNPEKNIPRAILLSALLVIPLYISVVYALVAPLDQDMLLQSEPLQRAYSLGLNETDLPFLNLAAQVNFMTWGGKALGSVSGVLISIAGMIASFSALGTSLSVQASILQGMSRDAYLPKLLLSNHKRYGTPYTAIIVGSLFVMVLSTMQIPFLNFAASIASLTVFALVSLSLMRLRKKKPYLERPFKVPLYPFLPMASVAISAILILSVILQGVAGNALISFIGLALLIFMTYYLDMLGRQRLLIALGGTGLGVSVLLASLAYVNAPGFNYVMFPISGIIAVVSVYAILRS